MIQKNNKKALIFFCSLCLTIVAVFVFTSFYINDNTSDNINQTQNVNEKIDSIIKVKVIVAGDAMMHEPQIAAGYIKDSNIYDYRHYFSYIKPLLAKSDLNIVNFESTLAGPPYSGYPQFCSPDAYAFALKDAGFNFFVSANNHSVDKGLKGINRTIFVFDSLGINFTGTFRNQQERDSTYPAIIDIKGVKIAILDYTYGTNGLKVPSPAIVNLIDTSVIAEDLKIAKSKSPDFAMVAMHWGNEYEREPSKQQKFLADFLFSKDVDVIIGSHPHVVQPLAYADKNHDKKQLVIWSLGNLISNQRRHYTDGGIMVQFDIIKNKNTSKTTIDSVGYYPFWVYKAQNPVSYHILTASHYDTDTLRNKLPDNDINTFGIFINDTRKHLKRDTIRIVEMGNSKKTF